MDLARLQNLVKRDPESYQDEFLGQLRHFRAQLQLIRVRTASQDEKRSEKDTRDPDAVADGADQSASAVAAAASAGAGSQTQARQLERKFGDVVGFVSQTASCYPKLKEAREVPDLLANLLSDTYMSLGQELRLTLVRSLILLRRRGSLSPLTLLPLLFRLFGAPDKRLRRLCHQHLVSDIGDMNRKHTNLQVNRTLQNFLFEMVSDESESRALHSLGVLSELYRKGVWRDTKTVNVVATAVFARWPKVSLCAVHFLLRPSIDEEDADDDEESAEARQRRVRDAAQAAAHSHARMTKKRKSVARRALAAVAKIQRSETTEAQRRASMQLEVLRQLHDPQSFAERLFARARGGGGKGGIQAAFEVRVLQLNLLARVVAVHELYLPNLYPFLQRYMQPHQEHALELLAMFVQCCHPMVESELLRPCLRTVANNFVHDRSSASACAVGLNTIREALARCPHALGHEESKEYEQEASALVHDLIEYRNHHDKGVVTAARSLLNLFREIAPELLPRASRGRPDAKRGEASTASISRTAQSDLLYGAEALTRVPGAELLPGTDGVPIEACRLLSEDEFRRIRVLGVRQMLRKQMGESDDVLGSSDDVLGSSDDEQDDDELVKEGKNEASEDEDEDEEDHTAVMAESGSAAAAAVHEGDDSVAVAADSSDDDDDDEEEDVDLDQLEQEQMLMSDSDEEDENTRFLVDPTSLMGKHKQARRTRDERLASVQAGREGREAYKSFKANKVRTSTTNEQKRKNQPFILTKQRRDVRDKHKRSGREKQFAEVNHKRLQAGIKRRKTK
mmetsp:Transcript_1830/g.5706  ORF Transcript_1830/g.5706 Transcript_1830/m.5706 type:complete len:795 (+) Transcript_1830:40-2424(+)